MKNNTAARDFSAQCYRLLSMVPAGKVTTYKEIAAALESKGYRAVGNAMNRNPDAPRVPCHRVVKSDGSIGGYALGQQRKISLLRAEGISIKSGKVEDLEMHLFRFS